jgi:hypothetical protein
MCDTDTKSVSVTDTNADTNADADGDAKRLADAESIGFTDDAVQLGDLH